jgi:hypothetical protein
MAKTRPIKTAQTAAANYGTNGSAPAAATAWAAGYTADISAIFNAAAAAVGTWQANVSTAKAATNFTQGLARAAQNTGTIATKVNGVGKSSFSAGVKAASTGNYATFAAAWQPALANEISTLNATLPGAANAQARMIAYNEWATSQSGKFRTK